MTEPIARNGILIVLSSPSGAGKSTMARRLLNDQGEIELSVSATTRAPREGETHGKDYLFVDRSTFQRMIDGGEFLEHAEVFGNLYGTPQAPVEDALKAGRDVLFDVDWQGGRQLKASRLGASVVMIFLLPPSIVELEQRLIDRAKDTKEVIDARMAKTKSEISHWAEYDYVLINDDLDTCYSRIETIVNAERLKRARQGGLETVIRRLDAEFDEREN